MTIRDLCSGLSDNHVVLCQESYEALPENLNKCCVCLVLISFLILFRNAFSFIRYKLLITQQKRTKNAMTCQKQKPHVVITGQKDFMSSHLKGLWKVIPSTGTQNIGILTCKNDWLLLLFQSQMKIIGELWLKICVVNRFVLKAVNDSRLPRMGATQGYWPSISKSS